MNKRAIGAALAATLMAAVLLAVAARGWVRRSPPPRARAVAPDDREVTPPPERIVEVPRPTARSVDEHAGGPPTAVFAPEARPEHDPRTMRGPLPPAPRLSRQPGQPRRDGDIAEVDHSVPQIPEPIARAALGWVGVDPAADAIWTQAINDPALTSDERQNLIEDLNEDSFPDPKHITADDLPLIVSRMQLIEELAPNAMDDVNAAAFAEAYKDLNALFEQVTR